MALPVHRPARARPARRHWRMTMGPALALLAAAPPLDAAQLQAYAGVVAGVATGTGPFACATSGPTIGAGWSAGLVLPTEGFAGCGLGGGIDTRTAAAGPLTAAQAGSGLVEGGSYTGQARASADHGRLGVSASGSMGGRTSSFTFHQSASFARFEDTLTLTAPGVATGAPGSIDFGFLVSGAMASSPVAPFTQQADLALGLRVGAAVGDPARGPWTAFAGTVVGDSMPFLRGGGTGIPGDFVAVPGSFAGSANVVSTADFGFQWGVPFRMEAALSTTVRPCCAGASMLSSFEHTAVLSAIEATHGGVPVSDFQVSAQSGTGYGPGGLLPVPEPASTALWGAGALALWLGGWRRRAGRLGRREA